MRNRKILLVDCGLKVDVQNRIRTAHPNNYADITILEYAKQMKLRDSIDRFLLIEHPNLNKKEVDTLFEKNRYAGVIVNGSTYIIPHNDTRLVSTNLTSGDLNATVLQIISYCGERGIPLLGICYGQHMLGRFAGEEIVQLPLPELGFVMINLTEVGKQHPLFEGVPLSLLVPQFHSYGITQSKSTQILARNDCCVQAMIIPGTELVGIQFHIDFLSTVGEKEYGTMEHQSIKFPDFFTIASRRQRIVIHPENKDTYAISNGPLGKFMGRILSE